jgi:hypothetical protein
MSHHNDIQDAANNGGDRSYLTDEQLMAYMEGKLSPEEQRLIEELISEEGPESDAIEGLKMMHPAETRRSVADLQRKLHTELLRNNPKRKNRFADDYWGWIAVVVILLLIVVGYIVVRMAS